MISFIVVITISWLMIKTLKLSLLTKTMYNMSKTYPYSKSKANEVNV